MLFHATRRPGPRHAAFWLRGVRRNYGWAVNAGRVARQRADMLTARRTADAMQQDELYVPMFDDDAEPITADEVRQDAADQMATVNRAAAAALAHFGDLLESKRQRDELRRALRDAGLDPAGPAESVVPPPLDERVHSLTDAARPGPLPWVAPAAA